MSKRHGGPGWWCALPDAGAATSVALLLGTVGRVLARHVSGRPWILGREVGAFCTVEADGRRIAVIGDVLATAGCLTRAAASGLEQVLALPGSFHTLISGPEEMTAVGDVCGFRRLFTTRCRQTYVVSSHADVLRRLTAARVNPVWLAARLASPDMPALLRERLAPFVGVEPVPPGWLVEITESRCGTRRWWQPPTAALPADAGAALLRTALARAVGGRADRSESRMGVQLSGGLDSTVLAVLTQKAEPVLVTTGGRSPIADDHHYARRVAASMPSCEHHVVPPEQAPLFFSRLDEPVVSLDEPAPFTAGITRLVFTAHLLRERGVGVCLNGQGGDEVLLAPLAYLGPALRVVPGTGWRHLRGHAALKNIPSLSLARAALRHETFTEWLFRHAFTTCIEPPAAAAVSGWEAPPLPSP